MKCPREIKEAFAPYIDEWGLIVEDPWEGGDAACETPAVILLCKWLGYEDFVDGRPLKIAYVDTASQLILMPHGLWRRHCAKATPNGWTDYWASEWDKGTRDNGTTLLIATIEFKDFARTKAMLELCKERWWLSPAVAPRNVWDRESDHVKYSPAYKKYDPTPRFGSPLIMWKSFFNRSVDKVWWGFLTLWFWDLFSCLFPILSIRYKIWKGKNDGNHLNAFIRSHWCYRNSPTWICCLAYRLMPHSWGMEIEFAPGDKRNPPIPLLTNQIT